MLAGPTLGNVPPQHHTTAFAKWALSLDPDTLSDSAQEAALPCAGGGRQGPGGFSGSFPEAETPRPGTMRLKGRQSMDTVLGSQTVRAHLGNV